MKKVLTGIIASAALLASSGSFAVQVSNQVKEKIQNYIGKSTQANYFDANGGLLGVAITMKNGQKRVVYSTQDGEHLIAGVMVQTASGKTLTPLEVEKYAPKADFGPLVKTLESKSAYIQQGDPKSDNELFVFVDANCGFCHKTYSEITKLIESGESLNVKWIPVGILGGNSTNKAQGLLGTDDQHQMNALGSVMSKMAFRASEEKIANGRQKLQQNMNIFGAHGFSGVPLVVKNYGGEVEIINGKPRLSQIKTKASS